MKYIPLVLLLFFVLVSTQAPQVAVAQKKAVKTGVGTSSLAAGPVRNTISLQEMTEKDKRILALANAAAKECAGALENAVKTGVLSEEDIFSTLYFPIMPVTSPPTFSTFYDSYTDRVITPIVDSYMAKDKTIIAVGLMDRNGYLPSHNSMYSRPLTGNAEIDIRNNRTKRIFNDITAIQASRNTSGFLLQIYRRDTGETSADLSVPVFVLNRHWGTLRIVYGRGE